MAASFLLDIKRNRGLAYDQSAATDKFTLCNQRGLHIFIFRRSRRCKDQLPVHASRRRFPLMKNTHGSYYKQYTGKHYHVELMLTAKQSEHGTSRAAATIWGMVIVPLNKPRYAPMCLPEIELVRMVKGIASIAAQAVPTRK